VDYQDFYLSPTWERIKLALSVSNVVRGIEDLIFLGHNFHPHPFDFTQGKPCPLPSREM
jgi:hypothetical protein